MRDYGITTYIGKVLFSWCVGVSLVKTRDISLTEESYEKIIGGFMFFVLGKQGEAESGDESSRRVVESEFES